MPEMIAAAAAAVVNAFNSAVIATSSAIASSTGISYAAANTLVMAGVQATASAAASALFAPEMRAEGSATAFRLDTDAGIPFAFGRVGTAGVLAYRKGFGPTNRYQGMVATLSGAGPIKQFVSFSADDETTTFGANDVATNGDHEDAMWLQRKLGNQPETAHTSPMGLDTGATATGWTSNHKMSGRATCMWTLYENSKFSEYRGGIPKPLHVIDGKFGWDPREDDTWSGGAGTCRLDDPSTWVWIENPAIAALNWCIGMWEGDSGDGLYGVPYECSLVGGIGASLEGIDVDAFVNAANVADANGWTVAAYPTTKDDKFAVLTNMLQAAGAYPSRKAGKISCVCHAEEVASALTVTAADTAGPVEVSLGQSRLERINTVLPKHWSPDHDWQMVQLEPITNAAWVTEDGGKKRSRGLDLPYVSDADQAAQLAYYEIANAREAITGTVSFKPHLRRIEPGDCFTFNEPEFLLSGVKLRCLKRAWDPMSGRVKVTFRQETDAKHAAAAGETGTGPTGPTPPTRPAWEFVAMTFLTRTVENPLSASLGTITVTAFSGIVTDGTEVSIPAGTLTGLDPLTNYGVFWREADGLVAVELPATDYFMTGSWVFIGWQATPDVDGTTYPTPTPPPDGYGGDGPAPRDLSGGGDVAEVLDGTSEFTALSIDGVGDVKPFLAKTDGAKLTDPTGLGANVVETEAVLQGAITPAYSAYTSTSVLWTAEDTEKEVQSVTVDVIRGAVRISALMNVAFDAVASAATTGTVHLYRDGVEITNAAIQIASVISSGGNWIFPPQWSLEWIDTPTPGTGIEYSITFEPGVANNGQVSRRSLFALPLEG